MVEYRTGGRRVSRERFLDNSKRRGIDLALRAQTSSGKTAEFRRPSRAAAVKSGRRPVAPCS
jgi:hypothetical protein